MPFETVVVFALIVGMFVTFGAVLYWGERRTRNLSAAADR